MQVPKIFLVKKVRQIKENLYEMIDSALENRILFEVKGLEEIRCVLVNACQ
jgi:hypothetical protein